MNIYRDSFTNFRIVERIDRWSCDFCRRKGNSARGVTNLYPNFISEFVSSRFSAADRGEGLKLRRRY